MGVRKAQQIREMMVQVQQELRSGQDEQQQPRVKKRMRSPGGKLKKKEAQAESDMELATWRLRFERRYGIEPTNEDVSVMRYKADPSVLRGPVPDGE